MLSGRAGPTGVQVCVVVVGDLKVYRYIMASIIVGAGGCLIARVVLVASIMLRTIARRATFLGLVATLLSLRARLTPPTPTTTLRRAKRKVRGWWLEPTSLRQ